MDERERAMRDMFAMQAIVMADRQLTPEQVAEICYNLADAMMAERARRDAQLLNDEVRQATNPQQ